MMERDLIYTTLSISDVAKETKMAYLDSTRIGTSSHTDISDIQTAPIVKKDSSLRTINNLVTPVASTSNLDVLEMKNISETARNISKKKIAVRPTLKREYS